MSYNKGMHSQLFNPVLYSVRAVSRFTNSFYYVSMPTHWINSGEGSKFFSKSFLFQADVDFPEEKKICQNETLMSSCIIPKPDLYFQSQLSKIF